MSRHAVLGLAAAVILLSPGTASARSLLFDGTARGDNRTTIRFTATDRKQRGDFTADRVSEVLVYNQAFTCYDAAGNAVGAGGRDSYPYSSIEPTKVKENGRFSGSYETTVPTLGETHTLEFRGKVEHGKATGTYESRESQAGIEADYCGDEEPWNGRRRWIRGPRRGSSPRATRPVRQVPPRLRPPATTQGQPTSSSSSILISSWGSATTNTTRAPSITSSPRTTRPGAGSRRSRVPPSARMSSGLPEPMGTTRISVP